ncbi:hypothetical protein [Pelagibius sp. Alg239-R121]|uniref:hypothetical protein n=1 Tax=Pelagibius sp. Alg239-R121 TaxID=2993448 RepID=UPI0024A6C054|nr:hypothetical protein [Pelagibius sp. Alg239-R121]
MNRTFRRAFAGVVLAASAFVVSGCATVIKGTDESISVITEPEGATCTLVREGKTVGVVNPTPGSVEVDRDKDDVTVNCVLEDYEDSYEVVSAEFSGYTVGNVIAGGLIGVAVDAASGANSEYPDEVTVLMVPKEFASIEQRDEVYGKLKARVTERTAKKTEEVNAQCNPDGRRQCEKEIAEMEEARDKEIAEIEEKRLNAKLSGSI